MNALNGEVATAENIERLIAEELEMIQKRILALEARVIRVEAQNEILRREGEMYALQAVMVSKKDLS
jgi:hypothetical protein